MTRSHKELVGREFGMRFDFSPAQAKVRTLMAVSKQSHCLNALPRRWAD